MRKIVLSFLFICLTCSAHALSLRVEQIQAADYIIAVQTIGKLVINGTTLDFYDRQGALLYSTDMTSVGALTFEDTADQTAVSNMFVSDRYVVYPNPTSAMLIVEGVNEFTVLRLYSTDGHLVKSVIGATMNVEDVPNGTYLLQCENQLVKIIKQ